MTTPAVTAVTQRRDRPHPLVVLARSGVVLLLIALVVASVAIAFAPAPAVRATPAPLPAPAAPEPTVAWPEEAVAAGFGVAGLDGSIEVAGSAEAVPMASLTKVLTVLVVLEAHPIEGDGRGAEIVLGRDDLNAVGAAIREAAPIVPVHEGLVVTQRDLIEWSLVDSAGNAMWSLANWAFGSIDAFLTAADDWTARHGLTGTTVADPSGLELASAGTIADMTRLALLAVAEPVVLDAMGRATVPIPGGVAHNTNPLLGEGSIDGGKTGTLRVWGRNLMVTAEREAAGEPRRVVAVILGVVTQDAMDAQMLALVESLWDDFRIVEPLPAGTAVAEYRAPWGASVAAVTVDALEADAFGQQVPELAADAAPVEPGAPRAEVGSASAVDAFGGRDETALRTSAMLAGPDLGWRFAHPQTVVGWYFD